MANGDPILVGQRTSGSGSTVIESVPPSVSSGSGTLTTVHPLPGRAILVGWNANSSGDGILGRAAPGGIGVWGAASYGERTPVLGDFGVFGSAISTGVFGFASAPGHCGP